MTRPVQLVVNGCSYMEMYASGSGHLDLAEKLGLANATSLAIGGSANTRIIRTTLKHSYLTDQPTFYLLGMTFLSRLEIPILDDRDEFEGRWTNPQNQGFVSRWEPPWTQQDTDLFVELKLKSEVNSIFDRIEDLMYKLVSMVTSLQARGHSVLVFQYADPLYQEYLTDSRLRLFQHPAFVEGYAWRATPWQHEQGVMPTVYNPPMYDVPPELTHREKGHHQKLNEFLCQYIDQHNILGVKHDLEPI